MVKLNAQTTKVLHTRQGSISFPTYIPVTTFGQTYPLDNLIRPYLPRLADAVMVSYHYAKQMTPDLRPKLPIWIDSGGFAALFEGSQIVEQDSLGLLQIARDEDVEILHPKDVLTFQEEHADVALTLDFPVPPGLAKDEAQRRQSLTIANAIWALENRRRRDMPLYACLQAWDEASARRCAQAYANRGFDGIAIGGLVPRSHNSDFVLSIVRTVREAIGEIPLHVLGLGNPTLIAALYEAGADSVDSSSYVQYAANGKVWADPTYQIDDPSPMDRVHLALCNLALATGRTLPLSAAPLTFSTLRLGQRR